MKKSKYREHLELALANLPETNGLRNAKVYLRNALHEVEKFEKKSAKRAANNISLAEHWKDQTVVAAKQAIAPEASLAMLNRMIQEEKERIAALQKAKEQETQADLDMLID